MKLFFSTCATAILLASHGFAGGANAIDVVETVAPAIVGELQAPVRLVIVNNSADAVDLVAGETGAVLQTVAPGDVSIVEQNPLPSHLGVTASGTVVALATLDLRQRTDARVGFVVDDRTAAVVDYQTIRAEGLLASR